MNKREREPQSTLPSLPSRGSLMTQQPGASQVSSHCTFYFHPSLSPALNPTPPVTRPTQIGADVLTAALVRFQINVS